VKRCCQLIFYLEISQYHHSSPSQSLFGKILILKILSNKETVST
jgi:hypothetical protein